MQNNATKIGISGMFWMNIMALARYAVKIVTTYFLARLLTPADYGEITAISVLVGFAEIFWMMGIGPAIVQKKELTNDDIKTGNTINIILGVGIFACIFIFAGSLCNLFSISSAAMLRVYSIVFLFHSISGVSKSLTQKKCRYNYMSIINVIGVAIYGIISIIFAALNFKAWSLIVGSMAEALFLAVAFLVIEPVRFKLNIKKSSAKSLLYFGGGYTIARFFSYIANNGDSFVTNKTLGKVLLGSYSKAYQLLMYPVALVGESLDQVLFPLLSKSQNETERLKRVFISGTGLILLISAPIAIVAYICAEPLVYFVLGNQWGEVITPFKIMVVGLFFRIGYKLSDSLIRAIGKVYQRVYIQVVYAALVVAGSFFGHFHGLAGIAFGVTLAFTINYFLMTALSIHYLKIRYKVILSIILRCSCYSIFTFLITITIRPIVFRLGSNFLICAIISLICFILYTPAFLFTRKYLLHEELNAFINQIYIDAISMFNIFLKQNTKQSPKKVGGDMFG